MKIIAYSYNIHWKEKNKNFLKIEKKLIDKDADLFILPEMFSTGFCMEVNEIADQQEETLNWMKTFARKKSVAICGSASVAKDGGFFNRFYFVYPDGSYEYYDKRHLFSYSGEDRFYTAGSERKVVEYMGVRILLQVCYDLRFPVFSRNVGDYDLAIYVANWPKSRIVHWKALLLARAIENQAFVIGVNRTGKDGNMIYYPESTLGFFADGNFLLEKRGLFSFTEIDLEKLKIYRNTFSFWKDSDDFLIKNSD